MKFLGLFLLFAFSFSKSLAGNSNLDASTVRMAMRPHLKQMKTCYQDLLKLDSGAAGKIVLDLEINDHGKVIKAMANAEKSRWQSNAGRGQEGPSLAQMESCLAGKMKLIQFPRASKGTTAVVTYPFVFGPR